MWWGVVVVPLREKDMLEIVGDVAMAPSLVSSLHRYAVAGHHRPGSICTLYHVELLHTVGMQGVMEARQ